MNHITWAIINTIAALVAVFLIKQYTVNNNYGYLVFAMISYLVLMISYINMLKYSEVSSVYPFLQVLQVLVVILLGIIFLKEMITFNKVIGILLGFASMYFLYMTF